MNQEQIIKTEQKKSLLKRLKRYRLLYLMALPPIITMLIFHYYPIYGIQIAFRDFRGSLGIWESPWAGLKHFIAFVKYPYFTRVVWNTFWINCVSLCTFPLPVIFAIMLNEMRSLKLKKICQTITYAPHFVSTVVVCSMIMIYTNREGLINIIIKALGGEVINFMSIPAWFAPVFVISGVWSSLGWGTIIYTATLSGVSSELIEAAKIDGATRMQVIWHVNLPHLKPTIITMFIMRMGSMLSVGYEKAFLLQNSLNMEASSIISTYTYEVGLIDQQFSYSAAIGLFNNLVNITLIFLANTACKKIAKIGLW